MRRLFSPVDIASLVFFRIAFGALMLWEAARYFYFGWIETLFIAPHFHFTYYGFDWITPWPGNGMYWHFFGLGLLAFFLMIGLFYRLAAVLFFLGFTYVFLLDQALYLNHFYLISLLSFLLIFLPANRYFSIDSLLRPQIYATAVPAWNLWLLRFQVGVPYFFGGLAKLNDDWLHGEPMRMWLEQKMINAEWAAWFFSYGGLLFDLLIVPCLMMRVLRPAAFTVAVIFHLLNFWLFNIGVFPWMMIAATTLFFDPSWPRRLFEHKIPLRPSSFPVQPFTVFLLSCYVLLQSLFPLRHFIYPGSVHWTEEGHNFSWHMKLRDKSGEARFRLVHPQLRTEQWMPPMHHLTKRQYAKMATRPDMLLQYARFLSEGGMWEVYADVFVSLNGREPRRLINHHVDLAKVKRSPAPAEWILPLTD